MRLTAFVLTLASAAPLVLAAQGRPPIAASADPARRPRADSLYVSNRPEDHPPANWAAQMRNKARADSTYAARAAGAYRFRRITYRSRVGDMDIPAYVFEPLEPRGDRAHPALVWVHGGVHGDWTERMLPFVKEAVARGYVVITPDYRGSTGHGREHHEAIDYGGHEVDDVLTAADWLVKNVPQVDPTRLGIMGWSHGGYITALSLFQHKHPFRAGAAIVPVTNLVFRLSYKGPNYQRSFATQRRIGGLPFERRAEYIKRSPQYHVDSLTVPLLVHLATNDDDVDFVEAEALVNALRVKKPELAETKIYVDPPSGHSFSRRVNPQTLEREDTPEQRDSWNRTWTFFEWNLRPDSERRAQSAER